MFCDGAGLGAVAITPLICCFVLAGFVFPHCNHSESAASCFSISITLWFSVFDEIERGVSRITGVNVLTW